MTEENVVNTLTSMVAEEGKIKVFKLHDKVQIFDARVPTTQEEFMQFSNEAEVLVQYCIDNQVEYAETDISSFADSSSE